MIKKILFISLIMCEVMVCAGCSGEEAEPAGSSVVEETGSTTADDGNTTSDIESMDEESSDIKNSDNETSKEGASDNTQTAPEETPSDTLTEPSTENNADEPSVSDEAVYEYFESYKIKKMYVKMCATDTINIRKGPDESYDRIDGLVMDEVANVIGQCVETGWYMVEHEGITGFVSDEYVADCEDTYNLVLGDECPYEMYEKTEYNGQQGWFYSLELGWQPQGYKAMVEEIAKAGYTVENFPVYVGTWRDAGDVMWIGYSK